MWRIGESRIGSYAGRIAPPGIPKMTSTPSCSSERIVACAPVIFTAASLPWSWIDRSLVRRHAFRRARHFSDDFVGGRDPDADRREVLQVEAVRLVVRGRERVGHRHDVVVE